MSAEGAGGTSYDAHPVRAASPTRRPAFTPDASGGVPGFEKFLTFAPERILNVF